MVEVVIHARFEEEADAKLAKVAKRAAKYGQVVHWSKEPRLIVRKRERWDGKPVEVEMPMVAYDVVGELPSVGEYRFIAQLERTPGGVLIAGEEVGERGRDWNGACEHCNLKRARSYGYVVEDAAGDRKIVGKACLADHVKRGDLAGVIWLFQFLKDPIGLGNEDEEGGWGYGGSWRDETLGIVAAARAAIALWGWAPASHDGESTAAVVGLIGQVVKPGSERDKRKRALLAELAERGDHYEAVAQEVIDWGAALVPVGDYQHNLKVALACPWVDGRRFGLAVSAAAAFDKAKEREDKFAAVTAARKAEHERSAAVSEWVGAVGEKVAMPLVLKSKVAMPDRGFGPSVLHVFEGPAGQVVKWFTSNALRIGDKPAEAGAAINAKFTVKKHAEFKDCKETIVLRLKAA